MVWTHEPCASKQDFRLNPRMEEETSTSSTNLGTYVGEADGSPCAKLRDVSSLKFDPRARPRSECECSHWPQSECECSHSDRGHACGAQSRGVKNIPSSSPSYPTPSYPPLASPLSPSPPLNNGRSTRLLLSPLLVWMGGRVTDG